jgi:hypothetical protein
MGARKFLVIVLALVTALLLCEAFVTLILFDQPDFAIYPKGIVAKEGGRTVTSKEGYAVLRHENGFGTYAPIDTSKPVIIYQGDSFTYAKQVRAEENYVALLETTVPGYEHVNAGNFGTQPADYYVNYAYFTDLHPVHHFIQVRYLDFEDSFSTTHSLHFAEKDGQLVLQQENDPFIEFFKEHPVLFTLFNRMNVLNALKENYLGKVSFGLEGRKAGAPSESVLTPQDIHIGDQLRLLQSKYGERFTFIYLPTVPTIADGRVVLEDQREELFKEEIFQEATALGIDIVDVTPTFIAYYDTTRQLPYGFANTVPGEGHLNAEGHRLVAEAVAQYLQEHPPTGGEAK